MIQIFVLPLVNDTTGSLHVAGLAKSNCYGTGLWAGFLVSQMRSLTVLSNCIDLCDHLAFIFFQLVITGSLGIRAAVHHSVTAVSKERFMPKFWG